MSIGVRHKEHPFPIPLTVSAHAEQKRAWTHSTNATGSRGTSSQTSHIHLGRRWRCGQWRWRRRRRCWRHIFVSVVVAFRLWNLKRVYVRDDIARWAQKLHTPPRMISFMTDSPQRNHPTVAICFTVRTPSKTRVTVFRVWLRVLWFRTGVCYACVDVELTFVFKVLHFPVPHLPILHFGSSNLTSLSGPAFSAPSRNHALQTRLVSKMEAKIHTFLAKCYN